MNSINPSSIVSSLLKSGKEGEALKIAADLGIDTPEAFAQIIDMLEEMGDTRRCVTFSTQATKSFPAHAGMATRYVKSLLARGSYPEAAFQAGTFMDRTGDHGLWVMFAECHLRSGNPQVTKEILQNYMPVNPVNADAWMINARALHAEPGSGIPGTISNIDYEMMMIKTDVSYSHAKMSFAKGLLLEAIGDFDQAWNCFEAGNSILDDLIMSWPDECETSARSLLSHLDTGWITRNTLEIPKCGTPVFLMGSASSGLKDVMDQMSSDPEFSAVGEMRVLERDLHKIAGNLHSKDHAKILSGLTRNDLSGFRDRYLDALDREARRCAFFVDATPSNIKYAPILQAMFPEAYFVSVNTPEADEIILTMRSPLDVRSHRYSADIAKTTSSIASNRRLIRGWENVMSSNFLKVEDSSDVEAVSKSIHPGWKGGSFTHQIEWPRPSNEAMAFYKTKLRHK
jgi:hypothetical protein